MQERLQLTEEDIQSALDTAARIGDDALQRASQGQVVPDSFTHGTSEQRQAVVLPRLPDRRPRPVRHLLGAGHLMGEVVNLRTVRKQRGRAEARRREAAKRDGDAAEAERLRREAELERRRLDGAPARR